MYIDPGVGGILLQVVIGFVVAIPFILKLYWGKIKRAFSKNRSREQL